MTDIHKDRGTHQSPAPAVSVKRFRHRNCFKSNALPFLGMDLWKRDLALARVNIVKACEALVVECAGHDPENGCEMLASVDR